MRQYYGQDLVELIKHLGGGQAGQLMVASGGAITSVDLGTTDQPKYLAKVMLEPLGVETGWLPIGTIYAGAGFGFVACPATIVGLEVTVLFEMGNLNCGKILLCNFNATDPPPAINLGDAIFLHESGSKLYFKANGDVDLNQAGKLNLAGGGEPLARAGDYIEAASGTYTDPKGMQHSITGRICSGSGKVQSG